MKTSIVLPWMILAMVVIAAWLNGVTGSGNRQLGEVSAAHPQTTTSIAVPSLNLNTQVKDDYPVPELGTNGGLQIISGLAIKNPNLAGSQQNLPDTNSKNTPVAEPNPPAIQETILIRTLEHASRDVDANRYGPVTNDAPDSNNYQWTTGGAITVASPTRVNATVINHNAQSSQPLQQAENKSGQIAKQPLSHGSLSRVDANTNSLSMAAIAESQTPPQRPFLRGLPPGVGQIAARHIEYGKTLARKNALYSARREFFQALQVIAESHDRQTQSSEYTNGLAAAWTALAEIDDFDINPENGQRRAGPAVIIRTHSSKIVSLADSEHLHVQDVETRYLTFAKEQLALSSGANAVAAEALHCLGKTYALLADQQTMAANRSKDKAVVMFAAALDCDPRHAHAANELGVLLARQGHLRAARERLLQSVQLQPTSQNLYNLAEIHQRLGERDLANRAIQLARSSEERSAMQGTSDRAVRWIPPQDFDRAVPDYMDASMQMEATSNIRQSNNAGESDDSKSKFPRMFR